VSCAILADRAVSVDSHRGKSITNAFNSLPLEYLLTESEDVHLGAHRSGAAGRAGGRSDVHIDVGEDGRYVFAFVSLPRGQFSEELRLQVQEKLMREFGATYADFGVYMDRYDNAIVHYYMTGREAFPESTPSACAARCWRWRRAGTSGCARRWSSWRAPPRRRPVRALPRRLHRGAQAARGRPAAARRSRAASRTCARGRLRLRPLRLDHGRAPGQPQPAGVQPAAAMNLSDELPLIASFGLQGVDEYVRPVHVPTRRIELDNYRFDVRPERIPAIMARKDEIRSALRGRCSPARMGRDGSMS
jgi:glutamate dehydrogenase